MKACFKGKKERSRFRGAQQDQEIGKGREWFEGGSATVGKSGSLENRSRIEPTQKY